LRYQRKYFAGEGLELHVDALFAYGREDGEQTGDAEQGADSLAEVDEDEFGATAARGDVEADEGAPAYRGCWLRQRQVCR
jgi:hypothetical protein